MFRWLAEQEADVVCLQETKAQEHQLERRTTVRPPGYHCYLLRRRGRATPASRIYARRKPDEVLRRLRLDEFDREGRYLEAQFGNLSRGLAVPAVRLVGRAAAGLQVPLPRGFMPHLRALKRSGAHYILCGDWNIAHSQIDLRNWRGNQKNSGFLPEERAWLDQLFGDVGYVDALPRGATRSPSSTPGGPTAARPGRRTSAGASTTRS